MTVCDPDGRRSVSTRNITTHDTSKQILSKVRWSRKRRPVWQPYESHACLPSHASLLHSPRVSIVPPLLPCPTFLHLITLPSLYLSLPLSSLYFSIFFLSPDSNSSRSPLSLLPHKSVFLSLPRLTWALLLHPLSLPFHPLLFLFFL